MRGGLFEGWFMWAIFCNEIFSGPTLVTRKGSLALCLVPSPLIKTVCPGSALACGGAAGAPFEASFLSSLTCQSFSSLMRRLVPACESLLKCIWLAVRPWPLVLLFRFALVMVLL